MSHAIGIDFGTEYSCIAVYLNSSVEVIPNAENEYLTPSCIAFTDTGHLIGRPALDHSVLDPKNTIFHFKRILGRDPDDPIAQEYYKTSVLEFEKEEGHIKIKVMCRNEERFVTPEELSTMFLKELKKMAEIYLGHKVTFAAIAVPLHYNELQRQATIDCGKMAGFDVVNLVKEPIAAAFAYHLKESCSKQTHILVLDIGGEKVDLTILSVLEGERIKEIAHTSNLRLGGIEIINAFIEHVIDLFKKEHNQNVLSNPTYITVLQVKCAKAMRDLCETDEAVVSCVFGDIKFSKRITRTEFEKLCEPFLLQIFKHIDNFLDKLSMINKYNIDNVIIIGGITRMPKIKTLLEEFFYGKKIYCSIDPDEVVACGASIRAAIVTRNVDTRIKSIILEDILPLSIGVKMQDGKMQKILPKGTSIPSQKNQFLYMDTDGNNEMSIDIYEGERDNAAENIYLGQIKLFGIKYCPTGGLKMNIIMEANENSQVKVKVKEKLNKIYEKVTLQRSPQGK